VRINDLTEAQVDRFRFSHFVPDEGMQTGYADPLFPPVMIAIVVADMVEEIAVIKNADFHK
jgi:hypothetical protein